MLNFLPNMPYNGAILELFEHHIDDKLELLIDGKLPVYKRRVVTTKWAANIDLIKINKFLQVSVSLIKPIC